MSLHQDIYPLYHNLKYRSDNSSNNFAILKLYVGNDELLDLYKTKIATHNESFMKNKFADSGFDLFVPNEVIINDCFTSTFIDMQVKAELITCQFDTDNLRTSPFYLYPRSSISKTPLMLANNVGIIDSGYRGNLIGAFRSFEENYKVAKHIRLLQLCDTKLLPIYVVMVNEKDLSSSIRGSDGFGSTGK